MDEKTIQNGPNSTKTKVEWWNQHVNNFRSGKTTLDPEMVLDKVSNFQRSAFGLVGNQGSDQPGFVKV